MSSMLPERIEFPMPLLPWEIHEKLMTDRVLTDPELQAMGYRHESQIIQIVTSLIPTTPGQITAQDISDMGFITSDALVPLSNSIITLSNNDINLDSRLTNLEDIISGLNIPQLPDLSGILEDIEALKIENIQQQNQIGVLSNNDVSLDIRVTNLEGIVSSISIPDLSQILQDIADIKNENTNQNSVMSSQQNQINSIIISIEGIPDLQNAVQSNTNDIYSISDAIVDLPSIREQTTNNKDDIIFIRSQLDNVFAPDISDLKTVTQQNSSEILDLKTVTQQNSSEIGLLKVNVITLNDNDVILDGKINGIQSQVDILSGNDVTLNTKVTDIQNQIDGLVIQDNTIMSMIPNEAAISGMGFVKLVDILGEEQIQALVTTDDEIQDMGYIKIGPVNALDSRLVVAENALPIINQNELNLQNQINTLTTTVGTKLTQAQVDTRITSLNITAGGTTDTIPNIINSMNTNLVNLTNVVSTKLTQAQTDARVIGYGFVASSYSASSFTLPQHLNAIWDNLKLIDTPLEIYNRIKNGIGVMPIGSTWYDLETAFAVLGCGQDSNKGGGWSFGDASESHTKLVLSRDKQHDVAGKIRINVCKSDGTWDWDRFSFDVNNAGFGAAGFLSAPQFVLNGVNLKDHLLTNMNNLTGFRQGLITVLGLGDLRTRAGALSAYTENSINTLITNVNSRWTNLITNFTDYFNYCNNFVLPTPGLPVLDKLIELRNWVQSHISSTASYLNQIVVDFGLLKSDIDTLNQTVKDVIKQVPSIASDLSVNLLP